MRGLIAEGEIALHAPLEASAAWLLPLSGPALETLKLVDTPGGLILGRGDAAQIKLPLSAEKVSRAHCRFAWVDGQWVVTDSSRWGTFVNGVRLQPNQPVSLREGDTLRIVPWTFSFSSSPPRHRGAELAEDIPAGADIRDVDDASTRVLGSNLIDLLTTSTERIHAARNEKELADAILDVAIQGTGLSNASVLKVVDASGRVEPIASRMVPGLSRQQLYSRSLVARARQGQVAELRVDAMSGNVGESVMQMKISAAICAPLMLGDYSSTGGERDVAALLYLDSRASGELSSSRPQANAAGFAMALARIASLAMANLRRLEMAVRVKETEHEIAAAAEAQRLILPAREGRVGGFQYHGESRPGQSIGGDFFDVVPVGPHKLAVALGDVTGKGIPASVLMTASFGFLHSLLESGQDVATAARMLTRFLHPRRPTNRFVTLWIGLFDLAKRELCYVDCGHGWAGMRHADGSFQPLDSGGGLPCGIEDDCDYQSVTVPLLPGSRAVIVSDGFVEQFGLLIDPQGRPTREQFGMNGIQSALTPRTATPGSCDDLKALFDSLIAFAGTPQLSDDATAILVRWD